MIFLSILIKTYALVLGAAYPLPAALCWVAGAAVDFQIVRKAMGDGGWVKVSANVALLQIAALVIGWGAACTCDYAAMRWKDGIPVLAWMLGGILKLTGLSVGVGGGTVYQTTMAGPLEFTASLDLLGLKLPAVFLVLVLVWLFWSEVTMRETARKLGMIACFLLAVVVARSGLFVLLVSFLSDFVGYESEELPYRPFMDEAAGAWLYLPFLLAAGAVIGRFLSPPSLLESSRSGLPVHLRMGGVALILVLAGITFWEPAGSPKNGKVVISTWHSQWSRSDRPYDREWYGADSGYNYACLKRLFGIFHPVEAANGPLRTADLEGASTLVIYDPDRRFSNEEIELVREFVRNGGGLFVIGDHTNVFGSASHLNELCEPFGFQYRDDVLFDLDEDFHQLIDEPQWASSFWNGMSMFKLRGPTSIHPTSVWTRSVYQVGHSKGVRAIYSVNNFYPPPHDNPRMKSGTFCVSASSRYGRGRVVAWGDSTVFSNFEIFYPGKYEYLLNTLEWLNHRDGALSSLGRRIAALVLFAGVAGFLIRRREPRIWLVTLTVLVGAMGAAQLVSLEAWHRRGRFPQPVQPSEWVVFAAHPEDKAHHLRDFITEEPYDQRYEVFIQWVLRTGAFSGFQILGGKHKNGLYEHLRASDAARTALALIVRKQDDLSQLNELAAVRTRARDPLLLMFATSISPEQATAGIKRAGLVRNADALARIAEAWPAGDVVIDDGGRPVMIVAGAERFSDQAMGISEKVVPDAGQTLLFKQAFGVIDRLFGREPKPEK